MVECPIPPFYGSTWADLAADNEALISVIESCNKRIDKIRTWRQQYVKPKNNDSVQ